MEALIVLSMIGAVISVIGMGVSNSQATSAQQEAERANKEAEKLAQNQLSSTEQMNAENIQLQKDLNAENLAFQREQFEYQKQLNALTQQREDTAFQRQVADLSAAGLSPLAVVGGSPASALSSTSFSGNSTAPQNNLSALASAFESSIKAKDMKSTISQFFGNLKSSMTQSNLQNIATTQKMFLENKIAVENLKIAKQEAQWMSEHGYRGENFEQVIMRIIQDYVKNHYGKEPTGDMFENITDKIKSEVSDAASTARSSVVNAIDNIRNKSNDNLGLYPTHVGPLNFRARYYAYQLNKSWSKDTAEKLYNSSAYLKSNYNKDAFIYYYSKDKDFISQFE